MTQIGSLSMSDYDADFDAPEVPRKGVSAEQQALVLACDLTDAEKSRALDSLSALATGDHFWPRAEETFAEGMADLYGLARDTTGLWRDAMVLIDPEHPELGYEFDPSSVQ